MSATLPALRHAAEDAAIILARPLFSVHRRPPAAAAQANPARFDDLPRLSGIIVTSSLRRALFESGDRALAAGVGGQVGPYVVMAIAPRAVTVNGPGGLQTLALRFGTDPPRPPAAVGIGILDRMRAQPFRPPKLPSSAAFRQMLLGPPQQAGP